MNQLLAQLGQDLTSAQKAGDKVKTSTLRFTLAKIHDAQIAKGRDQLLQDSEVEAEFTKEVKHHLESIEAFEKAGRQDLVKKENQELAILKSYLPKKLTDEEISQVVESLIEEIGAKSQADFGKVTGAVMAKVGRKADGKVVAEIVKKRLLQHD